MVSRVLIDNAGFTAARPPPIRPPGITIYNLFSQEGSHAAAVGSKWINLSKCIICKITKREWWMDGWMDGSSVITSPRSPRIRVLSVIIYFGYYCALSQLEQNEKKTQFCQSTPHPINSRWVVFFCLLKNIRGWRDLCSFSLHSMVQF